VNQVISDGKVWTCSCGAKSGKDGLKRFLSRHPATCSKRREFSKQLAAGTRSVEDDLSYSALMADTDETKKLRHWISVVNSEGRGLTDWERGFMTSITEQFEEREYLTEPQQKSLERIYANRA